MDNMDVATASAVAALAIAIVALVVSSAQALQQYFITGQLIRLCDSVVFGDLPGKGSRVWQMSQFRFRVVYEMPQIGLPPDLWPSSATASLARNEGALRDIMKLERKPTFSASPIVAQRLETESQPISRLHLPWNKSPVPKRVEGEASWALLCRAVYPSCRESILVSFKLGDADRCPAELPTVPMPASLRDIVVMALMAGMECTAASFERGSVSMQGAAGTVTSAQHPILGPLIHFSAMNMDVPHGVVSHGAITKEWLWRVMDNCIVAGNHYNGRGRRAVEMEIGKFTKRYRKFGPDSGKDLVPANNNQRQRSKKRRGSFERRRPSNTRPRPRRASLERSRLRPEERLSGSETSRPRQESPQRPIPGTDGPWSLVPTAASDLPRNVYAPLTARSNEPPTPDFRTFKVSQELRNIKAKERDARVRAEILRRKEEQRLKDGNPREAAPQRYRYRPEYLYASSRSGSESADDTAHHNYASKTHGRRRKDSGGTEKAKTTGPRARVRAAPGENRESSERSGSSGSVTGDGVGAAGETRSQSQVDGEVTNDNETDETAPGKEISQQALVKFGEIGRHGDGTKTYEQRMALVLRKKEPPLHDHEQPSRDLVLRRAGPKGRGGRRSPSGERRRKATVPRLLISGLDHERSIDLREQTRQGSDGSPVPDNRLRRRSPYGRKRDSSPGSQRRMRTYDPSPSRYTQRPPPPGPSRYAWEDERRAREQELSRLRAERDRINARLGSINWFWLSQTDILPGFWATPWRSFQDLNQQVCAGAINVLVEAISAVTGGAGLLFSEYPPAESTPMSENLAGTVSWLKSGKSTFPAYAYNSRGGVVCGGIFSSVGVPGGLPFANPIPAVELLFPASPMAQFQSADQKTQQDVERRLIELMRLDAWLSIVGRTRAIRDGPTALLIQTPAVVRSLIDTFELDFLDADTSSLEGGAQGNKAVAASVVDNLEANTLDSAEVLYALVATLRAVKVGECVLKGPDTAMLAEILEKDVQVSLV